MAKHPPYHLRTNKAVDRLLLVKQITKVIQAKVGLKNRATYHSLGGPFMEDLHLVHREIPDMPLICIETNAQTYSRQANHVFTTKLALVHDNISNFLVSTYEPKSADIFWLDFTDFSLSRLLDFQLLLRKVMPGSLVRMTVAANNPVNQSFLPSSIETSIIEEIKKDSIAKFESAFSKFLPTDYSASKLTLSPKLFNKLVQDIIRLAISETLDKTSDREFLHIQSCSYADGAPMLSVTGVVCKRIEFEKTAKKITKALLPVDEKWSTIESINLPFLSIHERHILNKILPHTGTAADVGDSLYETLNYHIEDGAPKTIAALSQYALYRHEYPSFVRLDI